jgi:hypothetical protein
VARPGGRDHRGGGRARTGRRSPGTGRPLGQSIARTYALSRAVGEYVKVLDSADQLTPGTLAREIDVLERYPDTGWTTCRVLDIHPDGTTEGSSQTLPADDSYGAQSWRTGARTPTGPRYARRRCACGGSCCSRSTDGWHSRLVKTPDFYSPWTRSSTGTSSPNPAFCTVMWPGQVTADPAHSEPAEWSARDAVVDGHAREMVAVFPQGRRVDH